jgi:DNA replication ATP-dependent helicase Dna2
MPSLGLKGKIDLTVEVSNKSKNKLNSNVERRILPLEIKTGKVSFSNEHRGQLILYTMLMDMTDRKTDSGLLLYLK